MAKLDQADFFFIFSQAVKLFLLSKNKLLRKDSYRDVGEIYKSLTDGRTSREVMEIAIRLDLISEQMRISGPDNTLLSTIELAAIVESWGPLTALQTIELHAYLHAAYEYYLFLVDATEQRRAVR